MTLVQALSILAICIIVFSIIGTILGIKDIQKFKLLLMSNNKGPKVIGARLDVNEKGQNICILFIKDARGKKYQIRVLMEEDVKDFYTSSGISPMNDKEFADS